MDRRKADRLLTTLVLLSMVLGVGLGLAARTWPFLAPVVPAISWMGVLFKQLLLLIIYPLVLASIFMGIVGLGDIRRTGRLALRTILYFTVTTGIAVALGLLLVNWVRPGDGFDLGAVETPVMAIQETSLGQFFLSMLKNTVKNPFASLAQGDVLGIIFFALVLGAAASTLGEGAGPLVRFMDALNETMMRLTDTVMWLAPLGVLALIADVVASQGVDVLAALARYAETVALGLGIHGLVVLPGIAWLFGGVPPWRLLPALRAPIAVAFSTASSSATLPVTIEACERNLEVSPVVTRFVLPLGATVNMDGTALYEAVAAMFIAQAYGVHLSPGAQVLVFLTATVAAVGAAGIPGAGVVTMGIVLQAVGLPLEAVGIILAVDRVLDMVRTAVNVGGDSVGTVVVQRWSRDLVERGADRVNT